jgi:membrane-associated phospholipid phosphatase
VIRIVAIVLLFWSTQIAAGQVFLDYGANLNRIALVEPPKSAFHDWEQAITEARAIAAAWKSGEAASLAWTRLQLARHIKHKTMPTRGARGLALVHVAMHDAYQLARDHQASILEARLAMSMAAAEVLSYLYIAEERAFIRTALALASVTTMKSKSTLDQKTIAAMAIGAAVAAKVMQRAEQDGAQRGWNGARLQYYGQGRYFGPGSWEPTPPYFYYPPDEPFAPLWQAWVLNTASQFRTPPPSFGSVRYLSDLREVIQVNQAIWASVPQISTAGRVKSAGTLESAPADPTDARFLIAKRWVDGHGSITPPGRWNQIAIDEAIHAHLADDVTLNMFATLDIAMADTFIAIWDSKYHYWTMRPITAAKALASVDLKPVVLTPPFPSYPSGHAGFSACAAEILSAYLPGRAAAFRQMAIEAANSRLYGGIHFRFDNEAGTKIGTQVAAEVLRKYRIDLSH